MAAPVSVADVRHVAHLARLGLSDERAHALTRELNTILEHMEALDRINTDGVAEYSAIEAGMRLRDDKGPPTPMTQGATDLAPRSRDGLLLVPRLATHEDAAE
ncbi:MAG: Asp-tRNA(Asn)/Glu-tRNA(Gln) amidotransferase subunit GatC [Gemmatimonadota bacterium]